MLKNFFDVYKLLEDLSNKKPKRKLRKFDVFVNKREYFEEHQNIAPNQGNEKNGFQHMGGNDKK